LKAIILAAGEGKRLRPLTKKIPKCMVNLFGKSLLEWQVQTFRKCGISEIIVITGFHEEAIDLPNLRYLKNPNYNTTNMVETLFCAKDELNGSVIVSYGDILFEKKILQKLIDSQYNISIIIDKNWEEYWKVRFENPIEDAESLVLDDNGYILDIGQKVQNIEQIQGQFIGLMKFQNEGLQYLKKFYEQSKLSSKNGPNPLNPNLDFEMSFMTDLLRGLINSEYKMMSVPVKNGWLELDSFHDYEVYTKLNEEKTLYKFISLEN